MLFIEKCLSEIVKSKIDLYQYYYNSSEAETEKDIIMPILRCLNWNQTHIECQFPIRDSDGLIGRADFALLNNRGIPKIIIEAKRPLIDFDNEYPKYPIDQLYQYVVSTKSNMGILSNGFQWWFFLPPKKPYWRFKRVFEINLINKPLLESINCLIKLLERENILSQKTWRLARKSVDKYIIDQKLTGMSDESLIKQIELIKLKDNITPEEKNKVIDLKLEAGQRNLPQYYD